MRRLGLISLTFVLLVLHAFPQSRAFISYSVSDGLAQSNVIDIGEDHLGNLWLATFGGLSKFNGKDFENFDKHDGLGSNRTFCLSFDSTGNIWIGTSLGISRYDGRQFRNYPLDPLGTNHWVSELLVDSQDRIWFGTTAGGLYQLLPNGEIHDHSTKFPDLGVVTGLVENQQGLWIVSYHSIFHLPLQGPPQKMPLPSRLEGQEISTIFADTQSNLWLGTSDGLYTSSDKGFSWVHSFHHPSLDFAIYSINQDPDGALWLGTTHGAYQFQHGTCTRIAAAEGLTDNIIYKIHRDREGTLWFGSFGGGVYKSLGELFTHIGQNNGMNFDYVSSISKANGHYWLGSYGGRDISICTFPGGSTFQSH